MRIIRIPDNQDVKLTVNISSEANVGSNVSLDDTIIKRSKSSNFVVELGAIENLNGKIISGTSNFFVAIGDIDLIKRNTIVECIFNSNVDEKFACEKVKLSDDLFVAFFVVKIEMI